MYESYRSAYIYTSKNVFLGSAVVEAGEFDEHSIILRIADEVMGGMTTTFLLTLASDAMGLVTYKAEIAGFNLEYEEGAVYRVNCNLLEMVDIIQRRENFKVKVSFPIAVSIEGHEKKVSAEVKDLSASGISFTMKEDADIGALVEFRFDRTSPHFDVEAKILRKQVLDDGIFRYGCKFSEMPVSKESGIRRYIFRIQLSKAGKNQL